MISENYDCPAQIRILKGNYKFIVKLSNGSLLEKNITFAGNQYAVIKIN